MKRMFEVYTVLLLICDVVMMVMIIRMRFYEKELDKKDSEIYAIEEHTKILEKKLSAYDCYVDGGWNCE